jgi:hypothetical protein
MMKLLKDILKIYAVLLLVLTPVIVALAPLVLGILFDKEWLQWTFFFSLPLGVALAMRCTKYLDKL